MYISTVTMSKWNPLKAVLRKSPFLWRDCARDFPGTAQLPVRRTMKTSLCGANENRAAFTLIEMLVVIAVIALLSSLMMPLIGKSREKAMDMNCQSNIKQSLVALLGFAMDHESNVPLRYNPSTTSPGSWRSWSYVLKNTGYMQDYRSKQGEEIERRAYSCPLSTGTEKQVNAGQDVVYGINMYCFTSKGEKSSYKISQYNPLGLWKFSGANSRMTYLSLMLVEEPTSFILLGEAFSSFYLTRYGLELQDSVIGGDNSYMWLRHNGHANVGFADGHVGKINRDTGKNYLQSWRSWVLPDYYPPES